MVSVRSVYRYSPNEDIPDIVVLIVGESKIIICFLFVTLDQYCYRQPTIVLWRLHNDHALTATFFIST